MHLNNNVDLTYCGRNRSLKSHSVNHYPEVHFATMFFFLIHFNWETKKKDKQTKVKRSLGRLFLRQLCGYVRMLLTWPCSRPCSTLIKILQSCKSAGTCLISSFVSTFSPPGTIHTEDNQHHVSPGDNKTNLCGTGRKTRADEASQLPLWPFYFF